MSRVQSSVWLLEAEYAELSKAIRVIIPIRRTLEELAEGLGVDPTIKASITCRVFEDNAAALSLATNQQITNRNRYYLTQWHHFWEHARGPNPYIHIKKVESALQNADYLTKPLPRVTFEANRKRVQGGSS